MGLRTPELESKRIFMIASADAAKAEACKKMIEKHISYSTIFIAADGQEALFKANNVVPHVAILDAFLPKIEALELTRSLLAFRKEHSISVILISGIPEVERFVDEVVTAQVQFLPDFGNEELFDSAIARALNRISLEDNSAYRLKFLAANEVLFHENENAQSLYFVKRGELEAFHTENGKKITLGKITSGEFVGEMAHFNAAARSATVQSKEDTELIEIPFGTLDMVLFSKPAWARALVSCLSRRLKKSNDTNIQHAE